MLYFSHRFSLFACTMKLRSGRTLNESCPAYKASSPFITESHPMVRRSQKNSMVSQSSIDYVRRHYRFICLVNYLIDKYNEAKDKYDECSDEIMGYIRASIRVFGFMNSNMRAIMHYNLFQGKDGKMAFDSIKHEATELQLDLLWITTRMDIDNFSDADKAAISKCIYEVHTYLDNIQNVVPIVSIMRV